MCNPYLLMGKFCILQFLDSFSTVLGHSKPMVWGGVILDE